MEASLEPDIGPLPSDMGNRDDAGVTDMETDQSIGLDQSVRTDSELPLADSSLTDLGTDAANTDAIASNDDMLRDDSTILDHRLTDQTTTSPNDANLIDAARNQDQHVHSESEAWAGTPSGGGFQCSQSSVSSLWYLMLFALIRVRGRS